MDGSQITGAASSYARKYALNGLFAIDDNADSDTTNIGNQKDQQSQQKVKAAITYQQPQTLSITLTTSMRRYRWYHAA